MLYEIGDRVIVRSDLTANENYSHSEGEKMDATNSMVALAGTVVTISGTKLTAYGRYYIVEEERHGYMWSDDMFDGLEDDMWFKKNPMGIKELFG